MGRATRDQQQELSRQQLVNMLSAGIWFENILNQALPTASCIPTDRQGHQYMLTELGDETRHMVMFGKIDRSCRRSPGRPTAFSA